MIPPSIVLIIYGLITETSIKALFTGAFVPGFMLATFIILYIVIRTQLRPQDAPLPEPREGDPTGIQKWGMFGGFVSLLLAGASALLLLRAVYFTVMGMNVVEEGVDPIALGQPEDIMPLAISGVVGLILAFVVFGRKRTMLGWEHGKGLVPPILVIGVVLGSIYGGSPGLPKLRAWVRLLCL